jgi:hypothetical protein
MDITKKAKEGLEQRIHDIEDFINEKGLGSGYLTKAKKAQRNVNIALVAVGALTIIGLAAWALSSDEED